MGEAVSGGGGVSAHTYCYRAEYVRAVDGDTVDLNVDLGFRVRKLIRVRILGLDTPELREPNGPEARLYAGALLSHGEDFPLRVVTYKDKTDKYGRWLADITLADGDDFATVMREAGWVKPGSDA